MTTNSITERRTEGQPGHAKTARVVVLPERFDAFTTIDFFLDSLDQGAAIVADGRAVKFADRQALQSLVDARLAILEVGGEFIVAAPSNELRATLDLTGFGALLWVIASPEESNGSTLCYRLGDPTMSELSLDGDLGTDRLESLRETFDSMLSQQRPRLEIDLTQVSSIHVGIVNLLLSVRNQARAQLGDINVIVEQGSDVHLTLSQVGILGVMRP